MTEQWIKIFDIMIQSYPITLINGALLLENSIIEYTNCVIQTECSYINIANFLFSDGANITQYYNIFDFNKSSVLLMNTIIRNLVILPQTIVDMEGISYSDSSGLSDLIPPLDLSNNIIPIYATSNLIFQINGLEVYHCTIVFGKFIQIIQGTSSITGVIFHNNTMIQSCCVCIQNLNSNISITSSTFGEFKNQEGFETAFIDIRNVVGLATLENLTLHSGGYVQANEVSYLEVNNMLWYNENISCDFDLYNFKIVNTMTTIRNSLFKNLVAINGVLDIEISQRLNLLIQNTSFINNSGRRSGALVIVFNPSYHDNVIIDIHDSLFQNNTSIIGTITDNEIAKIYGNGGAITLFGANHKFSEIYINNTRFINNTAQKAGGAIYWDTFPPILSRNVFSNNAALYGQNIASKVFGIIPSQYLPELINYDEIVSPNDERQYDWMQIFNLTNLTLKSPIINSRRLSTNKKPITEVDYNFTIDDIISGGQINTPLVFYLVDIYGQIIRTDNDSIIYLNFLNFSRDKGPIPQNPNVMIVPRASKTFQKATNGTLNFSRITVSCWPSSIVNVIFNVSISYDLPDIFNLTNRLTFNRIQVQLGFRSCNYGELFNELTGECYNCSNNTYTLKNGLNIIDYCSACPPNAKCFGGNRIAPIAGYWRFNQSSEAILPCPNKESCIGIDNIKDYIPTGRCNVGYGGNMCTECIKENQAFVNNECINCSSNIWYYFRYFLVLFIQLLLIIYSVRYNMRFSQHPIQHNDTYNRRRIIHNNNHNNELTIQQLQTILSDLLKLLITYFQFIAIIASFRFGWPYFIKHLYIVNKDIGGTSEQYFNLDCFLAFKKSVLGDDVTYLKYLIILLVPYIFMIFVILFWMAYFKIKARNIWKNPDFTNNIVTTIVISAFNFQPYMIKYAFMLFQCENLYNSNTPIYYWTANYQIKCFTNQHLLWALFLGIPTLILWIIILPLTVFIILFINRNKLGEYHIRSKFSFLYRGYSHKKYYWEFLIMFRKICLLITLVFLFYISKSFQAIFSTIIMNISLCIQIRSKPHYYMMLNQLEEKSLLSLLVMIYIGWYFLTSGFNYYNAQDWFLIGLVLLANIYFLGSWLYCYLYMLCKSNKTKIKNFITLIKRCFKRLCKKPNLSRTSRTNSPLEALPPPPPPLPLPLPPPGRRAGARARARAGTREGVRVRARVRARTGLPNTNNDANDGIKFAPKVNNIREIIPNLKNEGQQIDQEANSK